MTEGPQRKCPVCEQVMLDPVCPEDRMATLLLHLPVHDVPAPKPSEVLLGRYEVKEPIGQGGYGRVYRARHLGTGQDIALKILTVPAEEDGAFAVQRFFLEARATSGLTHPNTVRVFDFGQDDQGRIFLAMELLAGRTLREELRLRKARDQVFSEAEVVQIAVAITKSLSEAHEHGLVHRDLKPDNIFLHRVAGDDPVVKVLDFGIAKLGAGHRHTLSSDTSVPGTPAYMAPEHALNQAVDGRTDLYALGVVVYQLLTLQLPYQAPSDPQTLYMHAYEAVPDPRQVVPVSQALAEVVQRALQKRPEGRFDNARAMRDALTSALGAGPPAALWGPAQGAAAPAPAAPAETVSAMHTAPVEVLPPSPGGQRRMAGLVLGGLLIMTAMAAGWVLSQRGPSEARADAPQSESHRSQPAATELAPAAPAPAAAQPAAPEHEPPMADEAPTQAAASPAPEPSASPKAAPVKRRRRRASKARRTPKPAPPPKAEAPAAVPSGEGKDSDVLNMRLEELLEQP